VFRRAGVPSPLFGGVHEDRRRARRSSWKKRGFTARRVNPATIWVRAVVGSFALRQNSMLRFRMRSGIPAAEGFYRADMEGPEFSVVALVYVGEIHLRVFCRPPYFFPPYFFVMGPFPSLPIVSLTTGRPRCFLPRYPRARDCRMAPA
jgi:hypothetical protein